MNLTFPLSNGELILTRDTYANIVTNYPAASYSGGYAFATNVGFKGSLVYSDGSVWTPASQAQFFQGVAMAGWIVIGGSGATYSQTGTTVTVTWTGKAPPVEMNGANVHLTQSTGALTTGTFTGYTYVDANTFTCTSSVSQSTSGNLGSNTSKTTFTSYTMPSWTKAGINAGAAYLLRASSSASGKTFNANYSGIQTVVTPTATTTAGVGWGAISGSVTWVTPTTFFVQNQTGATGNGIINTESTKDFTIDITLANAGDWAAA